ncbi:hypothetical protein [uncultured Hyphomicrobium sp.]|uniref:hypothetical protein n=1 Tax=uncultured Hyphomicrobium sp. TaxID=194373 RepID=UPI0025F1556C|nr:hypothetical protein [uncultured Hyphomicrobium sp.]
MHHADVIGETLAGMRMRIVCQFAGQILDRDKPAELDVRDTLAGSRPKPPQRLSPSARAI